MTIDLDAVVERIWVAADETLDLIDPISLVVPPSAYKRMLAQEARMLAQEATAEAKFKQRVRAILEEARDADA